MVASKASYPSVVLHTCLNLTEHHMCSFPSGRELTWSSHVWCSAALFCGLLFSLFNSHRVCFTSKMDLCSTNASGAQVLAILNSTSTSPTHSTILFTNLTHSKKWQRSVQSCRCGLSSCSWVSEKLYGKCKQFEIRDKSYVGIFSWIQSQHLCHLRFLLWAICLAIVQIIDFSSSFLACIEKDCFSGSRKEWCWCENKEWDKRKHKKKEAARSPADLMHRCSKKP